jgi:hypothetical protein
LNDIPTKINDPKWIAWAAGLFEGEGTIFEVIRQGDKHRTYNVRLQMQMTDKDVVLKFDEVLNCIGHVYYVRSRNKKHKDLWKWHLSRRQDCKKVIELFWPYLGERRKGKAIEIGLAPLTLVKDEEHE